jgi:uncharacterized delta-60 repeat protein
MKRIGISSLLAFALSAQAAAAAPGDLDRAYGDHGRIAVAIGSGYAELGGATLGTDGRLLLSGHAVDAGGAGLAVARLTAGGRLDAALPATIVRDRAGRLATWAGGPTAAFPLAAGGLQVLGTLAQADSNVGVVRMRPAGYTQLGNREEDAGVWNDLSFGFHAAGMDAAARTLVVYHRSGPHWPQGHALLSRLRADGSIDTAFGEHDLTGDLPKNDDGGIKPTALLTRRDGSALVALTFEWADNRLSSLTRVVGLDSFGRPLPRFGTDGDVVLSHAGATAIIEGPKNTFLVAGNDSRGAWITRLRRDGDVDRTFGRKGTARPTPDRRFKVSAIARDRHGRIVLAGEYGRRNYQHVHVQAAAARLSRTGRHDRRFGLAIKQLGALRGVYLAHSSVAAVATDARDRILLAGTAWNDATAEAQYGVHGRGYFAVARLKGY